MTLRLQFEYIKNLINKQLSNTSRLAKLEVEFIISIQSIIYCIAVTNYSYTHLQSLTRLSSFKSVKNTPKQVSRKTWSHHLSPVSMPKNKRVIEDQLSELMKGSNSIKYIRYNQWKNIADRGEPLLSNEKLYSKRIAGISTLVLVKSSKSVKEVRKMIGLMRNKVYKEKNDKKAMTIKIIDTYRISLKSDKTSARDKLVFSADRVVANILNRASNNLDSLKKKKLDN